MPSIKQQPTIGFKSPFHEAIFAFLTRKKSGNLGPYVYSKPLYEDDPVRGGVYWEEYVRVNKGYYMFVDESNLIKACAKEIGDFLPAGCTYVDLGPGSSRAVNEKTLPMLNGLREVKHFISVDLNENFAERAAKIINQKTNLPCFVKIGHFFKDDLNIKRYSPMIFSIFGGTLTNISEETGKDISQKMLEKFSGLRSQMEVGDFLIVAQDTCNDAQKLDDAYNHPLFGLAFSSVIPRIKRDLRTLNFDPDDFDWDVEWDGETHLHKTNAVAQKDMEFYIEGKVFNVKSGEKFTIQNTWKFPSQTYSKFATQQHFESLKIIKIDGNPLAIHILRAI